MKKVIIVLAALSLLCAPAQAQGFLSKLKEKASEAVGGNLGNVIPGMTEQAPQADNGSSIQAVSGEQALPPKRSSTFGWDGPVTPSSAKFPIPLMSEFPAVPSASALVNPVEADQIAYYKAIKAVTLRAEELNADTTCEDSETLMWREKANQALKDTFGLTDEEIAMLDRDDLSEAEQQRLSDKISRSVLGGMDAASLEQDAAKFENMSDEEIMSMMGQKTLESQFAVYDRNAADIRKYMGVSTSELKEAVSEQMSSGNTQKASPKTAALQKKSEAYQKAEAAKNPGFRKEADAFQQKLQGELTAASKQNSRSMMGGMGQMMDVMENSQAKMAPFIEMQQKTLQYVQDVAACYPAEESAADMQFAASERKKVMQIKSKIYQTKDPAVYNPLYLEALEMIMSYRERAAKAWVADVQKRFNTCKETLPKLIKINRQAIADGIIPECALWREPLNYVIHTGDVLAEAYSEFPSDYPKMYMEEVVVSLPIGAAGPEGGRGKDDAGYHGALTPWWPEFTVYGPAYYDAIVNGEMIFAVDGKGKVYKHTGGVTRGGGGAGGGWVPVSDEEVKKLNEQKPQVAPASESWTSSDGKRTVYYNAEGGFLQLPEGDQAYPTSWKKVGNELHWTHTASKDTGDGCFEYIVVKCTYKL